ncbi:hypothetical protein MG293_016070 [Ovis ammon polii]|uniref:Uncharacterized protein n=1 Tax=Ovis ammon polii TaxID=230172 RepID=A0AAD4Y4F4_OVIAM|nr:hypothetical protein MG293_016070 [Ovis ammon polii]
MENGRFGLFHTFNAGAKVLPICGVLGAVLSVPGKQVLVMPYGILGTGYLHKHDRDLVLRSLAKMGPCWKLQYQSRNNQSQCVSSVHYAEAQRELIHWPRYQWLVVMVLIKEEIATLDDGLVLPISTARKPFAYVFYPVIQLFMAED